MNDRRVPNPPAPADDPLAPSRRFVTHAVENQAPPLAGFNAYTGDLALRDAVHREGAGWADAQLTAFGEVSGGELLELGYAANEHKPRLKLFDRYGHRLDTVEFHPSYHRIMELAVEHGVAGFAWKHRDQTGAHVARAAMAFLHAQAEQGTGCPLTMTYAAVPALAHGGAAFAPWIAKIADGSYDPRPIHGLDKRGVQIGMGMTEKQGGSDVRTNSTRAVEVRPGEFEIVGHKWFFSAPACDAHLVLAHEDDGLSCFMIPRFLPDGARNRTRIQRLKDKLGDWSNASSEVEFHGAAATRVGKPGRGIPTILQMVALTRLDCMMGSAAVMRQALAHAIHHARHRKTFGKLLVDHPLMTNVLADLALESEAATALTMRVARAVDASERDEQEAALARITTAIGKYWICKRCPPAVNEAQECLGGQGYVEESIMPRLYRQAPLNSIWEGSGNIQCLDVLRALRREPATRDALMTELARARGADHRLDAEIDDLDRALGAPVEELEVRSRRLTERAAIALQAAILLQGKDQAVAEAFCASRLGDRGQAFGTLGPEIPTAALVDRAALPA